jgi:Tfp pilus tip-associated adhesin PilY1
VWHTILVCPEGFWGNHIFALNVTDPDNWSLLWELTDTDMGHAYRAAINKVKWPVYEGEEITGYELKWVVFVATGYASIVEEHGGINVFAYDLISGAELWHFSQEYADSVNDIPGAVTLFDIDDDTFVDRVYVGDMNGRMWELNALDGTNPNGLHGGKQVPLWNCGIGKPISVSPAVIRINPVVVIFGTGGTDWAANDQAYTIYAVNATDKQETPTYAGGAGTLLWELELGVGEKVWSTPTIAAGQIYLATAFGTMESSNPRRDLSQAGQDTGNLYSISLEDGTESWSIDNIGKTRGSLYVDRQHVYLTTVPNEVTQVGGGDFTPGNVNNVVLRAWRQLN